MSEPIDVVLMLTRLRDVAMSLRDVVIRLCAIEGWRAPMTKIIEDANDDVVKLMEQVDTQQQVIDEQAARIARLELAMGIAIVDGEVRG